MCASDRQRRVAQARRRCRYCIATHRSVHLTDFSLSCEPHSSARTSRRIIGSSLCCSSKLNLRRPRGATLESCLITIWLCLAAFTVGAFADEVQRPRQIGETITLEAPERSPAFRARMGEDSEAELVWSTELRFPEAEYIAPFFSRFAIPEGFFVIVRSPDGSRSWRYTSADRARLEFPRRRLWLGRP